MYARGCLFGLTRGTSRNHIIRAALESIAFQSKDVIDAMIADTGLLFDEIKVDGGASVSDIIMQFQADIMNKEVLRPECIETTALGAAYLAGIAVGFWKDKEDIRSNWSLERTFLPFMTKQDREERLKGWKRAVRCAISYAAQDEASMENEPS